jgi:hypothetical protein
MLPTLTQLASHHHKSQPILQRALHRIVQLERLDLPLARGSRDLKADRQSLGSVHTFDWSALISILSHHLGSMELEEL